MKTDRRHELQQNDLAIYLNKINKSIEPYSRFIVVALGVFFVGIIAYGLYRNQQVGNRSDATLQLIQASGSQDAEDLLKVSEEYSDTTAGQWANLYAGQQYLSNGLQSLYNDRKEAEDLLNDAKSAFDKALSKSKDRLLVSRANLGIAQSAEALGDLDAAIAAYQEVITVNESEAMIELAENRIETLEKPETKEFIAWFADQDFSPADPSLPPSLPGGSSIPGLPDFELPDFSEGLKGSGEERDLEGGIGLPEVGGEGQPAEEPMQDDSEVEGLQLPTGEAAEAPATEAPATEAPATEAPATEAPATEAPATEAPATEAPATEAPATEAPATEAPATEAPATEAPATEAPATEAPATEAPATEAPATEAPATEAPATEAPATEAPATEAPATESDDVSSDS